MTMRLPVWLRLLLLLAPVLACLGSVAPLRAQAPVAPCTTISGPAGNPGATSCQPASVANPLQVTLGGNIITGNGAGTTGAVVGTLAAAVGKTTYICGFDVSSIGGTAATGPVTVAGLVGSSMVYQMSSTAAGITLSRTFTPCIPASAANTAITVTTTANGTATAVDVNSWGYQQ